ncbi:hypothetical protein M8Z33_42005 [Streptomyces sp. ZAF1911]|uniref:hypothetical protein n=1 Tax=Streptomyces sp. ZAF1911 TaxID=2944129 RepID=UPI00237BAF51|nr:hypothetical protein [Streptomyces sp. ZAF1911]MDD9383113.1 hypothetical protein [Streptomyces sp. ZAF1911]
MAVWFTALVYPNPTDNLGARFCAPGGPSDRFPEPVQKRRPRADYRYVPWQSCVIAGLVTQCEAAQSSAMDTRPGTGAAPGRERWGTTGFDVPTLRVLAFGFGACCLGMDRFAFTGCRSGCRTVRIPEPDPSAFAVRG